MKIFIGSSRKYITLAEQIGAILTNSPNNFEVIPWYQEGVFPAGVTTINRLRELRNICDGAVFIFGKDDFLFSGSRGKGSTGQQVILPRDNVVLEYGMFVEKCGTERCLIIRDDNVKIPTDLSGVTFSLASADALENAAKALRDSFSRAKSVKNYVTCYISKDTLNSLSKGGDTSWSARYLYSGSLGARLWSEVERDPLYQGQKQLSTVRKEIRRMFTNHSLGNYDCVISFGPGTGGGECEIVSDIGNPTFTSYIPIDINHYLAHQAAQKVDSSGPRVHIPCVIVGDFEEGMGHISEMICNHAGHGRAFVMFGGTFGNLEKGEKLFLNGLSATMDSKDIAILDVFTYDDRYEYNSDPFFNLSAIKSEPVRKFLISGFTKRRGGSIVALAAPPVIGNHLEAKAICEETTDILKTKGISIQIIGTGETIISVRRYDYDEFKRFLEHSNDFKVIESVEIKLNSSIGLGRAIFVITKKQ